MDGGPSSTPMEKCVAAFGRMTGLLPSIRARKSRQFLLIPPDCLQQRIILLKPSGMEVESRLANGQKPAITTRQGHAGAQRPARCLCKVIIYCQASAGPSANARARNGPARASAREAPNSFPERLS